MREMCRQRFGHPRLGLFARLSQREDAVDVGAVGTPGAVSVLLVDDEVVLQRRSRSPVARRIAASVPIGTVSESLPAIVMIRVPSALSQLSCEPACRTLIHPSRCRALRTSLNFLATCRSYAARRTPTRLPAADALHACAALGQRRRADRNR